MPNIETSPTECTSLNLVISRKRRHIRPKRQKKWGKAGGCATWLCRKLGSKASGLWMLVLSAAQGLSATEAEIPTASALRNKVSFAGRLVPSSPDDSSSAKVAAERPTKTHVQLCAYRPASR